MHVNKIAGGVGAAEALQRSQQVASPDSAVDAIAPTRGADAVELSAEGLAMANDANAGTASASLDPQRADQIRSKILAGAYNSLDMADQVARAVIRSGDL
jgi:hypothetical protein